MKFFNFLRKSTPNNLVPISINKINSKQVGIGDKILNLEIYESNGITLFDLDIITNDLVIIDYNLSITKIQKKVNKYDKQDLFTIDNKMYLTYSGLVRILFLLPSSLYAIDFIKWYENDYSTKNLYVNVVCEIFSKFEFPCVYLLHIGTYKNNINVYKFGRTNNFIRRYKELNKYYECVFKICLLQYVDPDHLSKAETDIHKILQNNIISLENYTELFSIHDINPVIAEYKKIGASYSLTNKEIYGRLIELQYQLKILELENQLLKVK
jgi:hypothetical protein